VIKAEFTASLLQSSVSHDPTEIIIIWCSRNSLRVFFTVFFHFYFRILWWIESSKEQNWSEMESFCNNHYHSKVWGQLEFIFLFLGVKKLENTFIHQGW